ncbi:hypothetical protein ACFZAR_31480 [Streptomyces sp. NPDC008222]|uniref:hypothetical protein n=1 Tax=Streptomyces sp. NPDC008222 TaxID=3364820 RepID=UPI0036E6F567
MLAIGTRVVVRSVNHLGKHRRPRRLIGACGVVVGHENGMNIVSLTPLDWLTGRRAFADTDVIAGVVGSLPWGPRRYYVRGYHIAPDTSVA